MLSSNTSLELTLKTLPSQPGVYQFYDSKENILYVGKAKNLKKRVLSYFQKDLPSGKIRTMVQKIHSIQTIVVNTEFDALLLENNLIKEHQPKYNSMLRDDKTYPWICIKNEAFPRVFLTRNYIKDGSLYFGPYPSVRTAKTLLDLIYKTYFLRTCSLNLQEEKIAQQNYKVCLEYHIKNCLGPCEGHQTEAEYNQQIEDVKKILKGQFSFAVQSLKKLMKQYADALLFEEAQLVKEKIDHLENYQSKSTVVNKSIDNVEIYSIISDASYAYINMMQIQSGAIVQSYTFEYKKQLEESDEDILEQAILEIRDKFESTVPEMYVPFELSTEIPGIQMTVPKIGDKKKIIELSEINAKKYRIEKINQLKLTDPNKHTTRLMKEMKEQLRMPKEPYHIEGFDNSNIQGTNPASTCVVFKNGKPSKKEYRHYNIKTVEGPNDFASMEEVIYRRYKRLLQEGEDLPQLIVIDGGKGQLSAALKSIDLLGLRGKITLIGIAKRLEEIYFPDDSIPLYLDKTSETLKVIQQVRNEAHRFSLRHHRNKRSKSALQTELDTIKGIGKQTQKDLLKHFKSMKKIKSATAEELIEVVGNHKAKIIISHFQSQNQQEL